ncbi:hypothetical protein C8F01DRAFT_1087904 [Mycena amicta]|nr:hypothetical protein C8F01DRAFT_1087904 [Mycena amicta]
MCYTEAGECICDDSRMPVITTVGYSEKYMEIHGMQGEPTVILWSPELILILEGNLKTVPDPKSKQITLKLLSTVMQNSDRDDDVRDLVEKILDSNLAAVVAGLSKDDSGLKLPVKDMINALRTGPGPTLARRRLRFCLGETGLEYASGALDVLLDNNVTRAILSAPQSLEEILETLDGSPADQIVLDLTKKLFRKGLLLLCGSLHRSNPPSLATATDLSSIGAKLTEDLDQKLGKTQDDDISRRRRAVIDVDHKEEDTAKSVAASRFIAEFRRHFLQSELWRVCAQLLRKPETAAISLRLIVAFAVDKDARDRLMDPKLAIVGTLLTMLKSPRDTDFESWKIGLVGIFYYLTDGGEHEWISITAVSGRSANPGPALTLATVPAPTSRTPDPRSMIERPVDGARNPSGCRYEDEGSAELVLVDYEEVRFSLAEARKAAPTVYLLSWLNVASVVAISPRLFRRHFYG